MSEHPKAPGSVAIIGPKAAIQSEVINGRKWQEVTSSSGVTSFVSQIIKPVLRGGQ